LEAILRARSAVVEPQSVGEIDLTRAQQCTPVTRGLPPPVRLRNAAYRNAAGGTAAVITGFDFVRPVLDDTVVIRD
jgi:hypothetical protein